MYSHDFDSNLEVDETKSGLGSRIFLTLVAIGVTCLIGYGAVFGFTSLFDHHHHEEEVLEAPRSYSALGRIAVRREPDIDAPIALNLKEGTIVSGQVVGMKSGIEWLSLTAVDGAKGFAPKALFRELIAGKSASKINGGVRNIVTSALLNLRETPSMSGKIVGTVDGGTRLVSDGVVEAEGELWMRVPLGANSTVFLLQRFTTVDDDSAVDELNVSDYSNVGVLGRAMRVANVQATPFENSRTIRALQIGEMVRVIGQTNSSIAWYILRLNDGSQGFAPRSSISIDSRASRWVYPDGTDAPGPNIPQGQSAPIDPAKLLQDQITGDVSNGTPTSVKGKSTQSDTISGVASTTPNSAQSSSQPPSQ
ncbi:SH3 domain-containing protein [Candidatus Phycosocius spiralis]|uniref:SH3b domain-containing protein n=1 Tax=Candidatus Phycosocius spiralis TaxID=2815099 RepID=A0ABQ4PSE7_9PROT|nr:SH3 domain-containing protein [Candidatus Phycosocius spiralis]GIU65901.1 hypothetical protein PsB1_0055 [Candidatus Phycosocius spiralis]